MARKTLAAELAEFKKFFEENKGIEVREAVRTGSDAYRVTTDNTAFDVSVTRDDKGAITEALITF